MSPVSHFDLHPDAELLNGFVEHALPAHEHADVVAHLAACAHCRQIVHLAQDAAMAGEPELVAAAAAAPVPVKPVRKRSWLIYWPVAGLATAALAATLLVVLNQQHHASVKVATAEPQPSPIAPQPAPAYAPQTVTAQPPASQASKPASPGLAGIGDQAVIPSARARAAQPTPPPPPPERDRQNALILNSVNNTSSVAQNAANDALRPAPGAARSAPNGGPSAQQNMQNFAAVGQAAHPASAGGKGVRASSSSGDVVASKSIEPLEVKPGASSETVDVSASAAEPAVEANPTSLSVEMNSLQAAPADSKEKKLKTSALASLPSGLPTVSTAAAGQTSVAVDAAGDVFVSRDLGKTWEPVSQQWAGRALKVRLAQPVKHRGLFGGSLNRESRKDNPAGAPAAGPQLFEIVNDKDAVWASPDGKTWSPR